MKSLAFHPKHKRRAARAASIVFAGLAALIVPSDAGAAKKAGNEQSAVSRQAGEPILAIVSLRDQQITVYDDKGWIMRAPVSSGQKGRETPAGIFSVLQKEADHYSNIYDDAFMPHMQRLTWSGIALHGGPLPGYAASHGCIRMPYGFAEKLFDATKLGMRVIVAPRNAVPVTISDPALLQPKNDRRAAAVLETAAQEKEAAEKAEQASRVAIAASRQSTLSMVAVRKLEILKLKAERDLAATERAIAAAVSPEAKQEAEDAKAKITARIAELEVQVTAGKAELQPKLDAAAAAREAATAAENARVFAAEAARQAVRDLRPISVFISRKTQRLYVRQASQPILESPITIQDVDRPIGTHIFTAVDRVGEEIQWNVISLPGGKPDDRNGSAHKRRDEAVAAIATDQESAKAALARITIPQDILDRIEQKISPRSSLIISDEALSSETGNATEFVVLLSGEPQGGLKHRGPPQRIDVRYDRLSVPYRPRF